LSTVEERLTALEKRQIQIAKGLVFLAKVLKRQLDLGPSEGGFGLAMDEEDQLDWLDELETDTDDED
jgi:hypothetical protein